MANNTRNIVLTDVLCEFLEVSVHNILYIRKLYPESIFVRKKKYGVVVFQSIHPQLNEYITESLKCVQFHAKSNKMRHFVVCIVVANTVVEKYNFDILNLQHNLGDGKLLLDLEQSMRNFLLKLHSSGIYLTPLSEDATFSLQIHTTELSNFEFNSNPSFEDFPWLQINGKADEIPFADIVPLCTVESECLTVQMYIEKCCKN